MTCRSLVNNVRGRQEGDLQGRVPEGRGAASAAEMGGYESL